MKYLFVLFLVLSGCTDAGWDAQIASYGESFTVSCYSGGKEIYSAKTTGRVNAMEGGGWQFRTDDNKFVRTFADCFVWYQK